jgi:hypothetical protein
METYMRKLLTLLIALAAITPAYADSVKSTFDFGPAYPERIAFLMLTCKTCHGARSVFVNGIELKRDVTSGHAEVAEIWSGPLPDGTGTLEVTIKSDYPLADAIAGMGAANNPPERHPISRAVRTLTGQHEYAIDVKDGDVVLSVSSGGGDTFAKSTEPPWREVEFGGLRSAGWNITHDSTFTVSAPSPRFRPRDLSVTP